MREPNRRQVVLGAAALGCAGAAGAVEPLTVPLGPPSWSPDGLQAAAAAKGLQFGTAVTAGELRVDPGYAPAVAAECGILVCNNDMKMEVVERMPGTLDFTPGDRCYRFAREHGMAMRGTTLVWYRGMPDWATARITPDGAEAFMRRWIATIMGRYRGGIESWDVINEVVDPKGVGGYRASPWLDALGPSYIDLAFHIAREADPHAALLWNEEDLEFGEGWMDGRRAKVLRTLEGLLKRGVPVQRFGMQAHLNSLLPQDDGKLRAFLAELAGMGLGIELTELDIDDRGFAVDVAARDRGVAGVARRFLDVALDQPAVLNVLTWDIVDRGTWYNDSARRRPDGEPQRSLPFANDYAKKPFYAAIRKSLLDAPDHSARRRALRAA